MAFFRRLDGMEHPPHIARRSVPTRGVMVTKCREMGLEHPPHGANGRSAPR